MWCTLTCAVTCQYPDYWKPHTTTEPSQALFFTLSKTDAQYIKARDLVMQAAPDTAKIESIEWVQNPTKYVSVCVALSLPVFADG